MEIIQIKGRLIHAGGIELSTSVSPWGSDNKREHQIRQARRHRPSGNTLDELSSMGLAYVTQPYAFDKEDKIVIENDIY